MTAAERRCAAVLFAVGLLSACGVRARRDAPQDRFWLGLSRLCGAAFEGRIAAKSGGPPGPDPFEGRRLVMHVRECSADEVRAAFHVGDDRSRTWVFTRPGGNLRLKHDHRHEDGSPDVSTLYGGDASPGGTAEEQSFPADAYSKKLFLKENIPQAVENVWVVGLEPGETFSYALTRPGRVFLVEFDLKRPVEAPPAPWGASGP